MSSWTDFVSKIYKEGHAKDPNYTLKQAMKDASARKKEMGSSSSQMKSSKPSKKNGKTKRKNGKKSKKTKSNRK